MVNEQMHGGEAMADWRARNRYPVDDKGNCACPVCVRGRSSYVDLVVDVRIHADPLQVTLECLERMVASFEQMGIVG